MLFRSFYFLTRGKYGYLRLHNALCVPIHHDEIFLLSRTIHWLFLNNSSIVPEQFLKYQGGTVVPQRGITVPRRGTTVPRRDLLNCCRTVRLFMLNNERIVQ